MRKLVCCIAVVIFACVSCITVLALTPSQQPKPVTKTIDLGDMQIRVEIDKDIYPMGELIQFRIFQKNLGNRAVQGGIGQLFLRVLDSTGRFICAQGSFFTYTDDFRIPPMEEVELRNVGGAWLQVNSKGEQVPPGTYTIHLEMDGNTLEFQVRIKWGVKRFA